MPCPLCGTHVVSESQFTDELSVREYYISGMCQHCQDEVFEYAKMVQDDDEVSLSA
jgi:hypothetical protein